MFSFTEVRKSKWILLFLACLLIFSGLTSQPGVYAAAPTNLYVTGTTSNSVSLAWDGSEPYYYVYCDGVYNNWTYNKNFTVTNLSSGQHSFYITDRYNNKSTTVYASTSLGSGTESKKIIAYYSATALNALPPASLPWNKVTHLIYAFAKINNSYQIEVLDPSKFNAFLSAAQNYPNVKVLVCVGGWTKSGKFHEVSADPTKRSIFVQSVQSLLNANPRLNGLDINWEFPTISRPPDGSPYDEGNPAGPEDKTNFTYLLRDLRTGIGFNKVLSVGVGAGLNHIQGIDPAAFIDYIDFINVMSYNYHGPWSGSYNAYTAFHSGLYLDSRDPHPQDAKTQLNVDWTMNQYTLLAGSNNRGKIILGIPFYGYFYEGLGNSGYNGLFTTYLNGGECSYSIIKELESQSGYVKYPASNNESKVPYLYNSSLKKMYNYDDVWSVQNKCDYVRNKGYGGVMFWDVNHDTLGFELTNAIYNKLK